MICKFILFFSNNEQSKDDTMWSKDKRYDEDSKGLIDEKVSIFFNFFLFFILYINCIYVHFKLNGKISTIV